VFPGRKGFALVVLLYISFGVAFGIIVPLWEPPDEIRHFIYAKYVADKLSLPPLSRELGENSVTLAFHPPLYHALMAPLASGYPDENPLNDIQRTGVRSRERIYTYNVVGTQFPYSGLPRRARLMRLASLALGVTVILCTWLVGREIFPEEPWLPFVGTAIVALNPQFLFITASINDNVLSSALGAVILLILTHGTIARATPGLTLALGIAFGAALLTTTSALLFTIIIMAGILAWGLGAKRSFLDLATVAVVAVAIGGWWYFRNACLYGDPFLWRMHRDVFGAPFLREAPMGTIEFLNLLRLLHRSFWGVFGSMHIPLSAPIYWSLEVFTGLCTIGFMLCIVRRKQLLTKAQFHIMLVFAVSILIFFSSIVRYNLTFISAQGRYMFAVLPAIGMLGACGILKGLCQKHASLAGIAIFLGLLMLDLAALIFFIWPVYA